MNDRRQLLAITLIAAMVFFSSSVCSSRAMSSQSFALDAAQFDERERGIELYEQGNTEGAIQALQEFVKRQKNDVRGWHYLGLALSRIGKPSDARKAYEKAAKIGEQLMMQQLEELASPAELDGRMIPLRTVLAEAADSADKYLELSSKPSRAMKSEWRERAQLLRTFEELTDELKDNHVYSASEVTTRARILSKPAPAFTDEALQNQISGRVILLLIFTAGGEVKGFVPLTRLPYGLTEKAVEAARRIRFTPALKDGKPVSQLIKVEYNFKTY